MKPPEPWVFGSWIILDEDRPAQKEGKPFWTLQEGDECLTVGPLGRKALSPDYILEGAGYECDGLNVLEGNVKLIEYAPVLFWVLTSINPFDLSIRERLIQKDVITKIQGG